MIKKKISVFLCLCLSFAVICYGESTVEKPEIQIPQSEMMPPMGESPSRGEMPQMGIKPTDETTIQEPPALVELEEPLNQKTENTQFPDTMMDATPTDTQSAKGEQREQGRMPFFGPQQQQIPTEEEGFFEKYFDAIASVILLILAYIFVILYKRRQY